MSDREKIEFKQTGTSSWKLRLHQLLRLPVTRTGPAIVVTAILYLTAYNVGVRYWKGENHPINRFGWRLQEQNGQLDPLLVAKKEKVLAYHNSRFYNARDTPPNLQY
ncbi:unnamed protein product [Caenorhabditis angaria]|uniref:Uncharacterized protein n=1 Tax=Caenorhabditis angaria TaxID=860376 RepID=A0A9P1I9U5_9PELO|nr:unnamed protein product [Caenorhabditis angaria]